MSFESCMEKRMKGMTPCFPIIPRVDVQMEFSYSIVSLDKSEQYVDNAVQIH